MKKLLFVFSLLSLGFLLSFAPPEKRIIVIDAGHGGKDFGAQKEDKTEKEINLSVAKYIQELCKDENFEIILLRDADDYPALSKRLEKIKDAKPEMVLSLHMNTTPEKESSKKGTEIYFKNDESKVLADKLAQVLNAKVLESPKLKIMDSEYPTLLIEMGFMNNKEDRAYLGSEKGQKETAEKIVKFLKS